MLNLYFTAFDNRSGGEVSSAAFLLYRGCLETHPEGRLIARHVDNQWQVDERIFLRFDCSPQVYCLFETGEKSRSATAPSTD